jgi:hypothetical protein
VNARNLEATPIIQNLLASTAARVMTNGWPRVSFFDKWGL